MRRMQVINEEKFSKLVLDWRNFQEIFGFHSKWADRHRLILCKKKKKKTSASTDELKSFE
jgi:hypothetical protein